jgi:hypothetical protein
MAVDMSCRLGWIDETIKKRTLDILQRAKLPIAPPDMMTVDKFKNTMAVRIILPLSSSLLKSLAAAAKLFLSHLQMLF